MQLTALLDSFESSESISNIEGGTLHDLSYPDRDRWVYSFVEEVHQKKVSIQGIKGLFEIQEAYEGLLFVVGTLS